MSCSHGDLFGEIGELVLAAQAGQAIDLPAKSGELAERYRTLGVSEEMIAKAITRSVGAISFSLARVSAGRFDGAAMPVNGRHAGIELEVEDLPALPTSRTKAVFPSGVRLAPAS